MSTYPAAEKVGFSPEGAFLIDATTQHGGRYFTVIPISPAQSRKSFATDRVSVQLIDSRNLVLRDDWDKPWIFEGSEDFIASLYEDCKQNDVKEVIE